MVGERISNEGSIHIYCIVQFVPHASYGMINKIERFLYYSTITVLVVCEVLLEYGIETKFDFSSYIM